MSIDSVEVHEGPVFIGTLRVTRGVYVFTYSKSYAGESLSPDTPREQGTISLPRLPGALSDCAPDRWGRLVVERGAQEAPTSELDYLAAVSDHARQGALRTRSGGEWQSDLDIPPAVELPRLAQWSRDLQDGDFERAGAAAAELLAMGTASLGGAHPKVTVEHEGSLWIAKLATDDRHRGLLDREYRTSLAARELGIAVPETRMLDGAFMSKRFDRDGDQRIAYRSAMTHLAAEDNSDSDYGDLLAEITAEDQRVLWERIVFGAVAHNTDDHFRNHGLLRSTGGWSLSPMFDVNPDPDLRKRHVTALFGARDTDGMLDAAMSIADDVGADRRWVNTCRDALESQGIRTVGRRDLVVGFSGPSTSRQEGRSGEVTVSEYTRADGTVVPEHSRASPQR